MDQNAACKASSKTLNVIGTVYLVILGAKDGNDPIAKEAWAGIVSVWYSTEKQSSTVCFSIGLLELGLMWMSNLLCLAFIQEMSATGQHWEVWSDGGVTENEPA